MLKGKEIIKKKIKLSKVKVTSKSHSQKSKCDEKGKEKEQQNDGQFYIKIYDDDLEVNPFNNR